MTDVTVKSIKLLYIRVCARTREGEKNDEIHNSQQTRCHKRISAPGLRQKRFTLMCNSPQLARETTDISQKRTDISQKRTDISQKRTDISQKRTDISRKTTDISRKTMDIFWEISQSIEESSEQGDIVHCLRKLGFNNQIKSVQKLMND